METVINATIVMADQIVGDGTAVDGTHKLHPITPIFLDLIVLDAAVGCIVKADSGQFGLGTPIWHQAHSGDKILSQLGVVLQAAPAIAIDMAVLNFALPAAVVERDAFAVVFRDDAANHP